MNIARNISHAYADLEGGGPGSQGFKDTCQTAQVSEPFIIQRLSRIACIIYMHTQVIITSSSRTRTERGGRGERRRRRGFGLVTSTTRQCLDYNREKLLVGPKCSCFSCFPFFSFLHGDWGQCLGDEAIGGDLHHYHSHNDLMNYFFFFFFGPRFFYCPDCPGVSGVMYIRLLVVISIIHDSIHAPAKPSSGT